MPRSVTVLAVLSIGLLAALLGYAKRRARRSRIR